MKIKSIKRVPFEGNVYNIGVANNNNYFANKCLVHNCYVSAKKYGDKIRNHVLLPLMASGRSKKGIEDGTFEYLEDTIEALGIKNVAFGAHFIKSLEKSHKIKTWIYPAETYSKNVLLKENEVVITSSSFNLTPVKVIKL